jgi:hypothetical protein
MDKTAHQTDKSVLDARGIDAVPEPFLYQVKPLPSPGDWSSASTVLSTPNLNDNGLPRFRPSASPHPFSGYSPWSNSPVLEAFSETSYFASAPPSYQRDHFASAPAPSFDLRGSYLAVYAASPSLQVEETRLLGQYGAPTSSLLTSPPATGATLISDFSHRAYHPSSQASEKDASLSAGSKVQQTQPDLYPATDRPAPPEGEHLSPPWWSDQISPTTTVAPTALPSPPVPTRVAGSGRRIMGMVYGTSRDFSQTASISLGKADRSEYQTAQNEQNANGSAWPRRATA